MKTVAMIPARSGSKSLPDKNVRPFAGKPLVAYSIEAALGAPEIDAVYLNSDSADYLALGERHGAKPFLRDGALAADDTPIKPVVEDFVAKLRARGETYDALLLLYPIYPIRFAEHLSAIVQEFARRGAVGSMLGAKEPDTHPYLCLEVRDDGTIERFVNPDFSVYFRRQTYPRYRELTHWAYITAVDEIATLNNQLIGARTTAYMVPRHLPIIDIDTELDFVFGEFLMQRLHSGLSLPNASQGLI